MDDATGCVNLPSCVKGACSSCESEIDAVFTCHGVTVCAAENASFDFAAALRSNFLQGKHEEKCKTQSEEVEEKCSKACGQCFENATEKDYSMDDATGCVNLPSCVKGACSSCESEIDAVFTCHGVTVCAAEAVSAVF